MEKQKAELSQLREALRKSWDRDTSSNPDKWSESNPSYGQCAVTALIVQDFLGGKLLRVDATSPEEKVSHYYNEIVPHVFVDFTATQFPYGTEYSEPEYREREYVLSYPATVARYNILKDKVIHNPIMEGEKISNLYLSHSTLDRHKVREQELGLEKDLHIDLHNPFYDCKREDIKELDSGSRIPYSGKRDFNAIVNRDLSQIDACDGVIAILGKELTPGTAFEIFYNSYVLKKPTYMVFADKRFFEHPWLKYLATERFSSIEEFRNWFIENTPRKSVRSREIGS